MNLAVPLILASNSPRRQQLLREAGLEFEIFTKDIDESFDSSMPVRAVAQFLSNVKNKAYREDFESELILTADTTVVIGDAILNKPENRDEAIDMLTMLSGNVHEVVTGVSLSDAYNTKSISDVTYVYFKNFTKEEITYYVDHYHPLDKAGAYGIQEWIGMIGVTKIEGSFYNVVGLPIHRVYEMLLPYQQSNYQI